MIIDEMESEELENTDEDQSEECMPGEGDACSNGKTKGGKKATKPRNKRKTRRDFINLVDKVKGLIPNKKMEQPKEHRNVRML